MVNLEMTDRSEVFRYETFKMRLVTFSSGLCMLLFLFGLNFGWKVFLRGLFWFFFFFFFVQEIQCQLCCSGYITRGDTHKSVLILGLHLVSFG